MIVFPSHESQATKGAAWESRPPRGVEKSMLIFFGATNHVPGKTSVGATNRAKPVYDFERGDERITASTLLRNALRKFQVNGLWVWFDVAARKWIGDPRAFRHAVQPMDLLWGPASLNQWTETVGYRPAVLNRSEYRSVD